MTNPDEFISWLTRYLEPHYKVFLGQGPGSYSVDISRGFTVEIERQEFHLKTGTLARKYLHEVSTQVGADPLFKACFQDLNSQIKELNDKIKKLESQVRKSSKYKTHYDMSYNLKHGTEPNPELSDIKENNGIN